MFKICLSRFASQTMVFLLGVVGTTLLSMMFPPQMNPQYNHPDNQSIAEKIKVFILDLFSYIWVYLSSFKTREIKLNQRNLIVEAPLGEGGFSFIYLVRDRVSGQKFALKQISIQLEEHSIMLQQEIAAHKLVQNNKNVISLIDSKIIQNGGKAVEGLLLLPLFKNGSCQDLIDKQGSQQISLQTICSIGIDICKGLRAFHSLKNPMAFRDLKPANLLLDDNKRAVLIDLGSVSAARVKISNRKESIALQEWCAQTCTAPFRAPELFDPPSNCLITEATDIWALGCTLYALAYGSSPFDGSMTAAISGNVTFPSNEKYGLAFQNLLKRILQTDPSLRLNLDQIEDAVQKLSSTSNFSANGL